MTTDLQLDRDAARVVERNRPFLASFTMPQIRPMVRLRWVLRDLCVLVYGLLTLVSFVFPILCVPLAPFWLISILRMHLYNRALRRLGLATILLAAGLACAPASAFDATDAALLPAAQEALARTWPGLAAAWQSCVGQPAKAAACEQPRLRYLRALQWELTSDLGGLKVPLPEFLLDEPRGSHPQFFSPPSRVPPPSR